MGEGFRDLRGGQTALHSAAQVHIELVVVTRRGERGDSDKAAIAHREIGASPHGIEHDAVGELHEFGRDRAQLLVDCLRPRRV